MIVFVGSDHNGFAMKKQVLAYLKKRNIHAYDVGDEVLDPQDDFPVFAATAVSAIKTSNDIDSRAILLCGSGQGMMIAANRFHGIRAGLGWSVEAAKGIRNDEDSNVLALPSALLQDNQQLAHTIIDAFLDTPFAAAPRYIRRNKELDELCSMNFICPTVTAYSLEQYKQQIDLICGFANRIHIDYMDGQFAPTVSVDVHQSWWPKR